MYGKNPNHANKFRRFFNKKYPPGNRCVVYSAISAGCIGHPAGSSCPCRGAGQKTVRKYSAAVRKLRKSGSGHARGPDGSASEYSGPTPGGGVRGVRRGGVWYVRRLSWRGRSRRLEVLRTGRSGADCSFGPFADGSDADRAASGCGYLISRSGCSRRKCSQLCDPLREAAFLPPPSPLTRSGPRTAWSGLEVV